MKLLDLNESEKQAFARRWERLRRRGMAFFVLRTSVLISVLWAVVGRVFDAVFDGGLSAEALSSAFSMPQLFYEWLSLVIAVAIASIVAWFGCEEMYKNFKTL